MAWKYSQTTGEFWNPQGLLVCHGFAGQKQGLNNPVLQDVPNIGPLPRGKYIMAEWFQQHPVVGSCAIELTPDPENEMFGRSGFFIHGLSTSDPLHSSEGCILVGNCTTRLSVWMSHDHDLEVTI